nr:MAG TPA: hypothetical protein [Caudoviricetes sp.]
MIPLWNQIDSMSKFQFHFGLTKGGSGFNLIPR